MYLIFIGSNFLLLLKKTSIVTCVGAKKFLDFLFYWSIVQKELTVLEMQSSEPKTWLLNLLESYDIFFIRF